MKSTDDQLAELLAKKFIQRKDVKAIQGSDGAYRPIRSKWTMGDLRDHISKEKTFGHYTCDADSKVKLFTFDIDLEKTGTWVKHPDWSDMPEDLGDMPDAQQLWFMENIESFDSTPRSDWRDRRHPGRDWYKHQLRMMAEMLSSAIHTELDIPVACAYSGNKGIHVYGFTGVVDASDAREAALMAMEYAGDSVRSSGEFVADKGSNFFKYNDDDPITGFSNLSIELFPKQSTMGGKDLGNLVRLPLGRNLKAPKDPTFFLDQTSPLTQLTPHANPVELLNSGNPWKD